VSEIQMICDEPPSWQRHSTWKGYVTCWECHWSKEVGRKDLLYGGHHPDCRYRYLEAVPA
jgi:hypothetical protein